MAWRRSRLNDGERGCSFLFFYARARGARGCDGLMLSLLRLAYVRTKFWLGDKVATHR